MILIVCIRNTQKHTNELANSRGSKSPIYSSPVPTRESEEKFNEGASSALCQREGAPIMKRSSNYEE
jgi:hypothetical protein